MGFFNNFLQPQIRFIKYFSSAWEITLVALKNNFLTLISKSGQFFKLTRTVASNNAYKNHETSRVIVYLNILP